MDTILIEALCTIEDLQKDVLLNSKTKKGIKKAQDIITKTRKMLKNIQIYRKRARKLPPLRSRWGMNGTYTKKLKILYNCGII